MSYRDPSLLFYRETIVESVKKTGRLIVVDPGWMSYGASGEIITSVVESTRVKLRSKPVRITLPDSHTPMSQALEDDYYINKDKILSEVKKLIND